jgi:hypothetical protein
MQITPEYTHYLIEKDDDLTWVSQREANNALDSLVLRAYIPENADLSATERPTALIELDSYYQDDAMFILTLDEFQKLNVHVRLVDQVSPTSFEAYYVYAALVMEPLLEGQEKRTYYCYASKDFAEKAQNGAPLEELFEWHETPLIERTCIAKGVGVIHADMENPDYDQAFTLEILFADILRSAHPLEIGLLLDFLDETTVYDLQPKLDDEPFSEDELKGIQWTVRNRSKQDQYQQDYKERVGI